jgi:hypothetical protein
MNKITIVFEEQESTSVGKDGKPKTTFKVYIDGDIEFMAKPEGEWSSFQFWAHRGFVAVMNFLQAAGVLAKTEKA